MKLDDFLDELFSNLTDESGINKIKNCIKNEINVYDTSKVEFQVFKKDNNWDCDVNISSEGYNDGEIIFVDCHIQDK